MAEPLADDRRLCPTRVGGAHSLIAHWITPATCFERQRSSYHKCFSCQYRGLAADVRLPQPARSGAVPLETAPVKVKRKKATKGA
ncbi:MAG: hypothetical protein EXS08_05130 [Planctomycetes bacterium]|nr:hypothetical protein [Planctomycetota bacterium]